MLDNVEDGERMGLSRAVVLPDISTIGLII